MCVREAKCGWRSEWFNSRGFVRLWIPLCVCGRDGMGLIKDCLELYHTVSRHRPSQKLNADWWRRDSEVIAWHDKILQEAASTRGIKKKKKDHGGCHMEMNDKKWSSMAACELLTHSFPPMMSFLCDGPGVLCWNTHVMLHVRKSTGVGVFSVPWNGVKVPLENPEPLRSTKCLLNDAMNNLVGPVWRTKSWIWC